MQQQGAAAASRPRCEGGLAERELDPPRVPSRDRAWRRCSRKARSRPRERRSRRDGRGERRPPARFSSHFAPSSASSVAGNLGWKRSGRPVASASQARYSRAVGRTSPTRLKQRPTACSPPSAPRMAAATSSAITKGNGLRPRFQPMTCCSALKKPRPLWMGEVPAPDHEAGPQDHHRQALLRVQVEQHQVAFRLGASVVAAPGSVLVGRSGAGNGPASGPR